MTRPKAGWLVLAIWCGLVGVLAVTISVVSLFQHQAAKAVPGLIIGSIGLGLAYLFGRPIR